jgi:hypothetical protein
MRRAALIVLALGGLALLTMGAWVVLNVILNGNALLTWLALSLPSVGTGPAPPQAPGTPVFISAGDVDVGHNGNIAFDASGAAIAVWETKDNVWANQFDGNTKTWGQNVMIDNAQTFASNDAQIVAVSPAQMVTLWNAADSNNRSEKSYGVWSAVKNAEKGQWASAVLVSRAPPAFSTHQPRMAANASNAVAVWREYFDAEKAEKLPAGAGEPKSSRIMSAVYAAGKGWGTPVQISDSAATQPEDPEVTIDKQGRATVVWLQNHDLGLSGLSTRRLYYSVLQPDKNRWTAPQMVDDPDPVANMQLPVVSSNDAGDTVIAWVQSMQSQGKCNYAMAMRSAKPEASQKPGIAREAAKQFTPEWPAQYTQARTDGMDYPCFITEITAAIDNAGNALVAWAESTSHTTGYVAYAPAGQPWRARVELPYKQGGDLRLAFVAPGKAVVVSGYSQWEPSRRRVITHQFDANNDKQPWSNSQLIDWPDGIGRGAFGASLVVSPNGQAISTWQQKTIDKMGFSAYTWNINDAAEVPKTSLKP